MELYVTIGSNTIYCHIDTRPVFFRAVSLYYLELLDWEDPLSMFWKQSSYCTCWESLLLQAFVSREISDQWLSAYVLAKHVSSKSWDAPYAQFHISGTLPILAFQTSDVHTAHIPSCVWYSLLKAQASVGFRPHVQFLKNYVYLNIISVSLSFLYFEIFFLILSKT